MAEDKAEKPVVESFQLDHTKVKAPYVRYIDTETGPHGDVISNYDLRLTQPNEQAIPTGGHPRLHRLLSVRLPHRLPPADLGHPPHRGSGQGPEGIVGVHRIQGHMG